jgi:uncharacterized protein YecE (DUF72 family)
VSRRGGSGPGQLDLFGSDEPPPPPPPLLRPPPCGLEPPAAHPDGFLIGACAWNHDCFTERFYPPGLADRDRLAYYARFCNAVEVDSSFYRVPTEATVARWAEQTPPHFRFALKAPRSVTHDACLDLAGASPRADWGPASVAALAPSLWRLLDTIPQGIPVAVEFRHPTWNTAEVHAELARRGVVRVWGDHYLDPSREVALDTPFLFEPTGAFRYVRLLGDMSTKYLRGGGRRFTYGDILFDRRDDLAIWGDRLRRERTRGIPVQVFINNHYEGFSLVTSERLRALLA